MSRYNKFEDFMQAVINDADEKCQRMYGKSLAEAYQVKPSITSIVQKIIDAGWWVFVALVALLVLGPIAFGGALLAFVSTPAGIIVVGVLAAVGGVGAIRLLYKNRILPIAVKETGEIYKNEYNNHINEISYIDGLVSRASDTLLSKATRFL